MWCPGLITARGFQGKFQCLTDILSLHRRTQFPGNDIARVVIKDRGQIHPAPANHLQVCEVRLPQLIDGGGVVLELICRLDDDEGRTGDQVMGFEQAVDGRL